MTEEELKKEVKKEWARLRDDEIDAECDGWKTWWSLNR